jgi:AraC family transcriptional activator of pyochelin receptor
MSKPDKNDSPEFGTLYRHEKGSELQFDLKFEEREGTIRLFRAESFTIVDAAFTSAESDAKWSHYNDQAKVEMNFVMAGQLHQSQSGLFSQQSYTTGYHNCLFNPNSFEESALTSGQPFRMLSLQVEPAEMIRMLLDYAPDLETIAVKIETERPFSYQSAVLGLPGRISLLLKTFWNSPVNGGLKLLHFESLFLQLLCYQFDRLLNDQSIINPVTVKLGDRDKLYHARNILLQQLSDPPGLASLARECQLNEFSLKKGFKQLFGSTVLGFVTQQRMEAARAAIYSGEKNINEIAYELGFASPQYFHRVFKKYFGTTPKALT